MEENQKPQITNYGNYSDSKGWFNRTKQTIGDGESKTSFWKVVAGVIAALAGIGGIIVALIKTGILSVNV